MCFRAAIQAGPRIDDEDVTGLIVLLLPTIIFCPQEYLQAETGDAVAPLTVALRAAAAPQYPALHQRAGRPGRPHAPTWQPKWLIGQGYPADSSHICQFTLALCQTAFIGLLVSSRQ
jgi:hypothetical protein